MKMWQQGDVLLIQSTMPMGVTVRGDGILAYGEATGHMHRLADATDGLLYEAPDGTLWLRAGSHQATVVHEEHQPLTLPPGDYRVGRVKEYDHFAEEARIVHD